MFPPKGLRILVGALLVIGLSAAAARAADVSVTASVASVTQLTTGGTAPTLTLTTVDSNTNRFQDATDFTHATYSVFNDAVPTGNMKVKGSFGGDTLPDGLELKVNLVSVGGGATSAGTQTFTGANQTAEQVLVQGITEATQGAGSQNKAIQFTLHQASGSAVTAVQTVNVTLTLTIVDE